MTEIQLDIISDVMCPWCFIGKRRLEKALNDLDPDIDVHIQWRPYQLDPTLPSEGKDRDTYLAEKFGGIERARSLYQNIVNAGDLEGIPFSFDAIKVSPNTLDAHRLIRWAQNAGEGAQDKVVERLFELYFLEGKNIGDHAVLLDIAKECGLDVAIVESLLATDSDRDAVSQEIAVAQQMGVTGVPCFIIDNKYAVMGAQDPQTIAGAISQAAEEKKRR
jgi:predicted DsbA family dithiol-disulfide isomerase